MKYLEPRDQLARARARSRPGGRRARAGGWAALFGGGIARDRGSYLPPRAQVEFAIGALSLLLVLGSVWTILGDYGAPVAVVGVVLLLHRLWIRYAEPRSLPAPGGAVAPPVAP